MNVVIVCQLDIVPPTQLLVEDNSLVEYSLQQGVSHVQNNQKSGEVHSDEDNA